MLKVGKGTGRVCVCFGVMWELVLHRMAREGLPEKLSLTKGDEDSHAQELYPRHPVSSDWMKESL